MLKNDIKNLIEKNIKNVNVKIFSDDNIHFDAIIISDIFKDKNLVERQQVIYTILDNYISNGTIHAFSFKTYTNEEYI